MHKLVGAAAALAVAGCAHAGWARSAMAGRGASLAGSTMSTDAESAGHDGDASRPQAAAHDSAPLPQQGDAKSDAPGPFGNTAAATRMTPNMSEAPRSGAAMK